jgi:hypothetical protein
MLWDARRNEKRRFEWWTTIVITWRRNFSPVTFSPSCRLLCAELSYPPCHHRFLPTMPPKILNIAAKKAAGKATTK